MTASQFRGPLKVSVRVITYNHGAFIRQALDSVLAQRVDFRSELVIGDDCSTDGTRDIILEYQRRHPERIRVLLSERRFGGRHNFVRTLQACQGEYVALLDGDDYWTSNDKLQSQVDFLDSRRDYAIVFHDALVVYEDGERGSHRYCEPDQPQTSSMIDLLRGNFIPACSTMFRRSGEKVPEWLHESLFGDWPLHILNARRGKIGYSNKVMGVYRIHGGGLSHSWTNEQYFAGTATILAHVRDELDASYEPVLRGTLSRLWLDVFFPTDQLDHHLLAPAKMQAALEHWPSKFPLEGLQRRQLLAAACVRVARASISAGERLQAGAWLMRAMQYDYASVRRWGFWSLAAKACAGRRPAEWLRRGARHAVHVSKSRWDSR